MVSRAGGVLALALLLVGCGETVVSVSSTTTAPQNVGVELGTVDPVIPVDAQDQTFLIYELMILNSGDVPVKLVRVGGTSGETTVASLGRSS